jgi:hypothetical protein
MLDATAALPSKRRQLRRGRPGQHHHVHVPRERRPAGHRSPHTGPRHHFPASIHAYDDEHRCVLCDPFSPSFPLPPSSSRAEQVARIQPSFSPKTTNHQKLTHTFTGCSNAQLVSALDSSDAGTLNIGQVFANGFPPELVNAAFGQKLASEDVGRRMTPVGTGSNWGPEECLKACGITRPGA